MCLLFSKKRESGDEESYKPVNIVYHMSKAFERILYKQISDFMTSSCSLFLCGFTKNLNFQCSFLKMIKTWRQNFNKSKLV